MEETIIRKALERYGKSIQIDKFIEEAAELTVALHHYREKRATMDDVVTELADVTVMIQQMKLIYGEGELSLEMERTLEKMADQPVALMCYYDFIAAECVSGVRADELDTDDRIALLEHTVSYIAYCLDVPVEVLDEIGRKVKRLEERMNESC